MAAAFLVIRGLRKAPAEELRVERVHTALCGGFDLALILNGHWHIPLVCIWTLQLDAPWRHGTRKHGQDNTVNPKASIFIVKSACGY